MLSSFNLILFWQSE